MMKNVLYCLFPFLRPNPPLLQPQNNHQNNNHQNNYQQNNNHYIISILPSNSNDNLATFIEPEKTPVYNYTRKERSELKRILGEYVNEIELTKIIMQYSFSYNQCESCSDYLKREWIRLPCSHYIHKKCFQKINSICPRCHEEVRNGM